MASGQSVHTATNMRFSTTAVVFLQYLSHDTVFILYTFSKINITPVNTILSSTSQFLLEVTIFAILDEILYIWYFLFKMQSKGECKINSASSTMTLHFFSSKDACGVCVSRQAVCFFRTKVMVCL